MTTPPSADGSRRPALPLGSTGQQRSFIEECRRLADPSLSGQLRVNGVNKLAGGTGDPIADPSDPALAQNERVNKSPENQAPTPLLTREPAGTTGGAVSNSIRSLPACRWCRQSRWWSIDPRAELLTCAGCHPPAKHLKITWHDGGPALGVVRD